jgi:hypothetical protein
MYKSKKELLKYRILRRKNLTKKQTINEEYD